MVYGVVEKAPAPVTFFTHGLLPKSVDDSQPPQKRKPFASISKLKWSHSMDMVLPAEMWQIVEESLDATLGKFQYAKVLMSIQDILEGQFFNQYIKQGNIMMLSEGRPGVDNIFSLYQGVLRLELDKATYERAGLAGEPIRDGGLKHKKNRYAVELNLRLPSMLHGRKGFERIVWASKNVLNHSLTWLFHDCVTNSEVDAGPIAKHHPLWSSIKLQVNRLDNVVVPFLPFSSKDVQIQTCKDNEFIAEVEEWLALVALGSARVQTQDSIDPYICRYTAPTSRKEIHGPFDGDNSQSTDLIRVRWHGFIPASATLKAFLILEKVAQPHWAAMIAHGFRNDSLSIMKLPITGDEDAYLEWEHPALL